jgi:hypothetical protein
MVSFCPDVGQGEYRRFADGHLLSDHWSYGAHRKDTGERSVAEEKEFLENFVLAPP